MNPTGIAAAVLAAAPGALYVASLGTPTSALRAASDDGPHLYMGGSMGTALAAALGVADKRPERAVVALLGDGETLMGASALWSLAGLAPRNLLAVVLVDGHYTITGGQPLGVPDAFGAVAAALGLATATARSAGRASERTCATISACVRAAAVASPSAAATEPKAAGTPSGCPPVIV